MAGQALWRHQVGVQVHEAFAAGTLRQIINILCDHGGLVSTVSPGGESLGLGIGLCLQHLPAMVQVSDPHQRQALTKRH